MTILVLLPLLGAGVLMIFSAILPALRRLPTDEYEQLFRAPAWLVVAIGGGMVLLSALGLSQMGERGSTAYFGWEVGKPLLMVDAYTLYGSALMGMVLSVSAWTPAARRSLLAHAQRNFILVLVTIWFALIMMLSIRIPVSITCFLLMVAGCLLLWTLLCRPRWHWEQMEFFFIFLFATVLTSLGLFWLLKLAHGSDMLAMWSVLLSQSPQLVNSAVIFIIIGWLGLAVYLPWWIWGRREESALILLPMILAIAIVCVLSLVRVIFLLFPAGGDDVTRLPGVENIFLIERIIGWLFFWGILAILMGSCWLCVLSIRQRIKEFIHLKPLSLVISGVLLLTLAGGLAGQFAGNLAQRDIAMTGMLWGILAWCGITTIWLTAGNLFNVMTLREQGERMTLTVACWIALVTLLGIPPTVGFYQYVSLWRTWQHEGSLPLLVGILLLIAVLSVSIRLPGWIKSQIATLPREGVTWGVIGPFAFAMLLVFVGLLNGSFNSLIIVIRLSLLQAY